MHQWEIGIIEPPRAAVDALGRLIADLAGCLCELEEQIERVEAAAADANPPGAINRLQPAPTWRSG